VEPAPEAARTDRALSDGDGDRARELHREALMDAFTMTSAWVVLLLGLGVPATAVCL